MAVRDIADIRRHRSAPGGGDELLPEVVDRLFGELPRADQRTRAKEYMTGLLVTPGKKSLRRMAAAVSQSPSTSQALQQFLNASPWEWDPVRHALAEWAEERQAPVAWSLGPAVLPKRGNASAGVHRRFVPDAARTLSCQLGIGLFLVSAGACVPVDWRLALPGDWQDDGTRRTAARIPDAPAAPTEGACALDLVRAQVARAGRRDVPLVADLTQVPHDASFLPGLLALGTGFVAEIPGSTPLRPAAGAGGPVAASRLVRRTTAVPGFGSGVVPGTDGAGHSRVRTCAVRLTHGGLPAARRPCVLIAEETGEPGGPRYFVTDLARHRAGEILGLAGTARRTRHAVRDMGRYGLLDFEGRSYPGWHHHMTLVSAAYAFACLTGTEHPTAVPAGTSPSRAA
ncbi:IS701 family transposase [Streptomyces fuscigenes]|uniref:IS701 family transposase n=1 Tax=Streptomyces fuscigenes TaxID=1528880 RepID=UPI001F37C3C2|nr:transposase [Streptomyces fuscigenes]MCF3960170.1 transposase [Streptomyces fuscigenes]